MWVSYVTRQIGHALLGPWLLEAELDFIRSQVAEAVERSMLLTVSCQGGDRFGVREQACPRLSGLTIRWIPLPAPGECLVRHLTSASSIARSAAENCCCRETSHRSHYRAGRIKGRRVRGRESWRSPWSYCLSSRHSAGRTWPESTSSC